MIFNRISIEGFGCIGKKITINFPIEGKIGIFGNNESGKSTFFDSIEFALFGKSSKTKEEMINWNKEKLQISLDFTSGDKSYRIERVLSQKSHNAKLVELINGQPAGKEITTVTEIHENVEDILGLDRESYSKLIYIRQKELDALKGLARTKRTELVNKVMGIQIFDDALKRVKDDYKKEQSEIDALQKELEYIKRDHDKYEGRNKEVENLRGDIEPIELKIKELIEEMSTLKSELEKHANAKECMNKQEILKSKISERDIITKQIDDEKKNQLNFDTYKKFLTPEFEQNYKMIDKCYNELKKQEEDIKSEEEKIKQKQKEIPEKTIDEPKTKQKSSSNRNIGIICIIIGGITLAMLPISPLLIIPSIVLFVISASFLRRWKKLQNELKIQIEKFAPAQRVIKERQGDLELLNDKLENTKVEYELESSNDAKRKLDEFNKEISEKLSAENLEAAKGIMINLDSNSDEGEIEKLENEKSSVDDNIKKLESDIDDHKKSFPTTYNIENAAKEFEETEKLMEKARSSRNLEDNNLTQKNTRITTLEEECKNLKSNYEIYPAKLDEVKEKENSNDLLDYVSDQFKRISTQQRELVLPQAEITINDFLPVITNSRYSNLEISEDLEFTVYVQETNGFKKRDVFSGGTQDQFLIALRLAFTKSILDNRIRADEYSFFMDEPISSSDEIRKAGIFELLNKVKSTFKQIFIVAHENISDDVDYHLKLRRDSDGFTEIELKSWK